MRRKAFDNLLGTLAMTFGVLLLAVGGLLLWGSAYIHNTVHDQLAAHAPADVVSRFAQKAEIPRVGARSVRDKVRMTARSP